MPLPARDTGINRSYSLFFIDRQNGPCHVWIENIGGGLLHQPFEKTDETLWTQDIWDVLLPDLFFKLPEMQKFAFLVIVFTRETERVENSGHPFFPTL
jgi:hypothetical protein